MKNFKWIYILFLLIVATYSYAETLKQDASNVTGAVDPGLTGKRLSQFSPSVPSTGGAIKSPEEKATPGTGAEAKIHFKLTNVIIKGNTVFSTEQLKAIFEPLNQTISVADLQNKVNAITTKYRSAGYVLSRAFLPPQVIKNGVVTVQVVEGFIGEVKVEGKPGKVERIITRYSKPVLASRPLQIKTLERSILLMNDLPGTTVKAVITPSKTTPGAADLALATEQKKLDGYLAYDNYGTRYLGPQEISAGATLNSATFPGASDSLHYMTVPKPQELKFIEYIHTQPVGSQGGIFTLGGNYTNTMPQFILEPFDIVGRSNYVYANYSYPWIRSREQNFILHATANYQNVSSTILGGPFYNDLLRSIVLGGDYNIVDRWHGYNDARIDFEKGFDILGAQQHLLQSRPLGVPNFFKTNVGLSRLQALPWTLSFLASLQGQYAFEPLLATEQYAFGGPIYGRGYDPSEIVGDDGFAAKFELRKDFAPSKLLLQAIQFYGFYDAGIVWNRDGINLLPKQSATSIGGGARITFMKNLSGNLYYAKPLTHSLGVQVAMGKDPLKPRIFFQIIASL